MPELSGDGWYPSPEVAAIGISVAAGGGVILRS